MGQCTAPWESHRDGLTLPLSVKDFRFFLQDLKKYKVQGPFLKVINGCGPWLRWFFQPSVHKDISAKGWGQCIRRSSENKPLGKISIYHSLEPDLLFYVWWMLLANKLVPSPSWRTCHQLLGKRWIIKDFSLEAPSGSVWLTVKS